MYQCDAVIDLIQRVNCRSQWPIFHSPLILPKTIFWCLVIGSFMVHICIAALLVATTLFIMDYLQVVCVCVCACVRLFVTKKDRDQNLFIPSTVWPWKFSQFMLYLFQNGWNEPCTGHRPTSPWRNFLPYDFPTQQYIRRKMTHASFLAVGTFAC